MATFRDSLAGQIKKGFCRIISDLDKAVAIIQRKATGDEFDDLNPPRALNRLVCDRPTPTTPPPPPFTGGQCCGVTYQFTVNYTGCGRQGGTGTTCQFGQDPYSATATGFVAGKIVSVIDGPEFNGVKNSIQAVRENCDGTRETIGLFNLGSSDILLSYSVSFARTGGATDTCGDPPPIVGPLPPDWNKDEGDITFTNNDGVDITVPVVAVFGYARVDIDANLTIPVNVDVGGVKFDLDFNLNTGDIKFFPVTNNFGDRRPRTKPPDILPPPGEDSPPYPPSLPPSAPPINVEEGDRERVIVGALVTTSSVDTREVGTLFQDDNPNISIPNLGHISFLCRVGYVASAWTEDIPVKNQRQVISCPWEPGAFKVAGTPRKGVTWNITPLYSLKEQPIEYPVEVT